MFTGIVEATGKVVRFEERQSAWLLELEVPQFIADSLAVSEKFALFTPSRKGFANILIFAENKIIEEKEIEMSAINDFAECKKFTLRQRKNQPVELSQFEEIQPTPTQIFQALKNHNTLLSECDLPPDAKSLTKREYAKWKAQAHI